MHHDVRADPIQQALNSGGIPNVQWTPLGGPVDGWPVLIIRCGKFPVGWRRLKQRLAQEATAAGDQDSIAHA
jgi:hypothetical protein